MARPLKIPREQALNSAMEVFWSRGYNATTIDDLQKAMGLQRGSFYLHFKEKRTLFFEVLDHYKTNVVEVRRKMIRDAPTPVAGIKKYFQILIDSSLANPGRSGCLNTNTVTELGLTDPEISARLGIGLKAWQDFWREIIEQAQEIGEIEKTVDARSAASMLVALTQGINVIVKVNPDRRFLKGVVEAGLAQLDK